MFCPHCASEAIEQSRQTKECAECGATFVVVRVPDKTPKKK